MYCVHCKLYKALISMIKVSKMSRPLVRIHLPNFKSVLTSNVAEEVPPLYAAAREGVGSAGAEAEDELRPCNIDNDYDDDNNYNDYDNNDKINSAPRHWRLAKLRH